MRSLWLAIVLALLGSSLLAQAAPPPTVPAPSDAVMRDAIRRARVLLDSGVAARDPGALAALFAPNATFIYGADTLRGRDAIEGFLSGALAAATWLDLRSSWERLDRCTDGMREIGGQFTVERTVPTSADTVVGGYSALWVMAPDGAARIGRLV